MNPRPTRYSQVTRRAFLGGLSIAAIASTAACSNDSSTTTTTTTSSGSASSSTTSDTTSSTSSASSSSAASGDALPTSAKATISWTFGSSNAMKNPYMAVWIEDSTGAFVKTVVLYHLAQNDRWLNELTNWYQASGGTDTTTTGTVPAGTYTADWDGSKADGTRATAGKYYVCVESAVEHGSDSLVRQEVEFGSSAANTTLTPTGDITAASVAYTV